MTRKDYNLLANALSMAIAKSSDLLPIATVLNELIPLLQQDNPLFNRQKFLDAVIPDRHTQHSLRLR